jgi:uncharacterized phiE125 gp8 family phage protein
MSFCRVDDEEETPLVADLVKAAREYVELHTGHALIRQTWKATIDRWPQYVNASGWRDNRRITLEKFPLISVDEVAYYDANNVQNTYLTDQYIWDAGGDGVFGFLERNHGADWPDIYDRANAISITFKAGYGTNGAAVPAMLKHAMKLVIENFYSQRDPVNTGNIVTEVPLNLRHLVESHRVAGWVA